MISALECKIPPLIYLLIFVIAAALLALCCPVYRGQSLITSVLGVMLAAVGLLVTLAAARQFTRSRTSVSPLHPQRANALVFNGLFRFSRNPMYLGMLLVLAGWVLVLGGLSGGIVVALFVMVMTHLQILPEERVLHEKFGDAFLSYKNNVRRWL